MKNSKTTKTNRRKLRINQTDAEALMWKHLRNRRLAGWKFRRQHSIGSFIVDFYCPEARICIELDGGQHMENEKKDLKRTAFLEAQGNFMIRYWNHEVLQSIDIVLADLLGRLVEKNPHPARADLSRWER